MKKCRNCTYEVKKGIRRCPYCGILNPTVKTKDIVITIVSILVIMYIYTFLVN